ncbi:MAG TPA: AtpZ/AtpI family protein [Candidatus Ozemobacteraceae bacterium]|nr:AtpZ/AtpI family protein [Candidatus Ozemobacteraceae bacterium]
MHPAGNGRSGAHWSRQLAELGPVLTLGLQIGVALALGIAVGYAADLHLQTDPWGLCLGTAWGMAAAFRNTWRVLRRSTHTHGR